MTTGEDTLERRYEGHYMSINSDHPRADEMPRYEWTSVWIANVMALMSMKTSAELIFIDIALMLKINELENISFCQ
jgi:hypothetical protein